MKQIEYTEKQKLVLEIIGEIDKLFKPNDEYKRAEYFNKIKSLKNIYGIKDKYLTLREYIKKNSCGSYHYFIFDIDSIHVNCTSVDGFTRFYNEKLLDKYFVTNDSKSDNGGNCENYQCNHFLELVLIEK